MKRLAILAIIVCAWFHLAPAHAQFNGCSSFCGTSSSAIADAPGFNNFQNSGSGSTLACSYSPVTTGTQNVAYTGATPSASGGVPAYTFSETGALPTGLSINTSTGVISGTPSVSGTFTGIQVKVADTVPTTVNCGAAFTLVISAAANVLTYNSSGSVAVNGASSGSVAVTYSAGCTRIIAAINWNEASGPATVSTVALSAVSFTEVATSLNSQNGTEFVDLWESNTAVGGTSGSVAVTWGSNVSGGTLGVAVYCLSTTTTAVNSVVKNQSAFGSALSTAVIVPSGGSALVNTSTANGNALNSETNWTLDASPADFNYGHSNTTGSYNIQLGLGASDRITQTVGIWGP